MVSKQVNKKKLFLVPVSLMLASLLLIGLVVAFPLIQNQIIVADEKLVESPTKSTQEQQSAQEQQSTNDDVEDELSLSDVLNRKPYPKDYSNKMNCVISDDVREYEVLSSRFIVLEVRRIDEEVVIQFDAICVGLKPNSRLGFQMRTSNGRLCKDDHVSVYSQDVFNTTSGSSGSCRIPGFQKVNEIQLDQLKRGIALKVVE